MAFLSRQASVSLEEAIVILKAMAEAESGPTRREALGYGIYALEKDLEALAGSKGPAEAGNGDGGEVVPQTSEIGPSGSTAFI
jgi:hypothetical protein